MPEVQSEEEKKNKTIAAFTTAGVTGLVVLLLLLVMAWRAPNPPNPEYGIELNFGLDDRGSGAVQPREPVGTPQEQPKEVEETRPEEKQAEPEEKTATEDARPSEPTPNEQQVTTKQESPVSVKEEKKEEKPVEKPKEKPAEKKVETKKEEQPKIDPKATYNPNTSKTENSSTTKSGKEGSQGDDTNKAGDKGNPQGTVDAKALYGKSGGGDGGPSLNLDGWDWDEIPRPVTPNNESGRIVFRIKVDSNGELLRYDVIEKSVSPEVERACVQAIQRLTFSKKPGAVVPPETTGTITFVIRSK